MQQKRVVITGIGLVTSLGNDVASTWQHLVQGKSGAGSITHFDASKFKTQFACEVKNLDMSLLLDSKELRRYDRYIHYAIKSAEEAMQDAQINVNHEDALRCGVIYGSGMGGINTLDVNIGGFGAGDGTPRYTPFFIPMIITNMAAGMLAIRYGFKGVNFATTSACSSSAHAIANACYQIRMGLADIILTGGSEAAVECSGVGAKHMDVWVCALFLGVQGRNHESPAVLVIGKCGHDKCVPRYFCQFQNSRSGLSSQYLFGWFPIAAQWCRVGA